MNEIVYAPFIPITTATYINGDKVWDNRWYVNMWLKIKWFFSFKKRKHFNEIANKKIDTSKYAYCLVLMKTYRADN